MQSEQCTDSFHMRTSPPWLQHRDLNLFHDLNHYLFQTCFIHNFVPHTACHPTNARNFIALVTFVPLCHYHQTTLSFSLIVSRGFVTVPNRRRLDGEIQRIRLLCSIPRISLPVHDSHTALLFKFSFNISCPN